MSAILSAQHFIAELEAQRSEAQAQQSQRYFKTGPGQYGEGDIFLGVRSAPLGALVKQALEMPLSEIEKLLDSPYHEARSGGVSIMRQQARRKKTPPTQRQALFDLYLRRHDRINNWDLVDISCPDVIGAYLMDQPRDLLYTLARSENLWERRSSIIATLYFIDQGDLDDTFRIAEMLLGDTHDLIHKAVGWALREAGKRDRARMLHFLDAHAATMPRTCLRYAIEHLDAAQRAHYMGLKKKQGGG